MKHYQCTLAAERASIAIMRVENGWLIRTADDSYSGEITPLQVAETADMLSELVMKWAAASSVAK